MAHLLVSAAHKSSGKTTVTVGLCSALARRGLSVQPFKKGPDYIDPLWLGRTAGRPCHNLDFYLMERREIRAVFARHAALADISIIEGNKGLYDGLDLHGSNSNAALARLLGAPVILVIDARGMTRGIAPLILGYQAFEPGTPIAGVILNKLGGTRHEAKLRAVIEHYTDVPVLGAVHHHPDLEIVERHLGLVPSNEAADSAAKIERIGSLIAEQVDLERLLEAAARAPHIAAPAAGIVAAPAPSHAPGLRIGVARDAAFGFYYPGDLEALEAAGAEIVNIDTLNDPALPAIDGLFLGGGFPEAFMDRLEANASLRRDIRDRIEAGLPVYAECGGLMYLSRRITWDGKRREMVGALPADVRMHAKPQGRGYVRLRETGRGPWPLTDDAGAAAEFPAHEFHYSSIENLGPGVEFAYEVLRGFGIDGRHDGIVYKNVLACYSHLRDVGTNHWVARFVAFVRKQQRRPMKAASL